jgi:ABC-type dipeptide/oligopeptide/nickel transport system permease subunit
MARYSLRTDSLAITGIIGILALLSSMTIAFIVGLVIAYLFTWIGRRREQNKQ